MSFDLPDFVSSALSLVKRNNGVFKSPKQAKFLKKLFKNAKEMSLEPKYAGIVCDEENNFSYTDYIKWSPLGGRSIRSYGWVFEYDDFGITRQWKLKWKSQNLGGYYDNSGNYRVSDAMELDTEGSKLVFERPEDVSVDHLLVEEEEVVVNPGSFIGNVKDRLELNLTVKSLYTFEGTYGTTTIISLEDENENSVVWFASSNPDLEVGDSTKLRGTVKEHKEYRGRNQTVLTRCKRLG